MLHNLTVEKYRLFEYFEVTSLSRVNLIVGTNNSGKSSLLEAIPSDPGSYVACVPRAAESIAVMPIAYDSDASVEVNSRFESKVEKLVANAKQSSLNYRTLFCGKSQELRLPFRC